MALTNVFKVDDLDVRRTANVGTQTFTPSAYVYTLSARDNVRVEGGVSLKKTLVGPAPEFIIQSGEAPGYENNTIRILGNLQVDGSLDTVNSTDLNVQDKTITLAHSANSVASVNNAGIIIDHVNATILYDSLYDNNRGRWVYNRDIYTGTIEVSSGGVFPSIRVPGANNSGNSLTKTFYGQITPSGRTIETFDSGVQSAEFTIIATNGSDSSTVRVDVNVNNVNVTGSIYGLVDNGLPMIQDIDASIDSGKLVLSLSGSSGTVVVKGNSTYQ